jgi:hypothetical protein
LKQCASRASNCASLSVYFPYNFLTVPSHTISSLFPPILSYSVPPTCLSSPSIRHWSSPYPSYPVSFFSVHYFPSSWPSPSHPCTCTPWLYLFLASAETGLMRDSGF